jgi:hypothetical protein
MRTPDSLEIGNREGLRDMKSRKLFEELHPLVEANGFTGFGVELDKAIDHGGLSRGSFETGTLERCPEEQPACHSPDLLSPCFRWV